MQSRFKQFTLSLSKAATVPAELALVKAQLKNLNDLILPLANDKKLLQNLAVLSKANPNNWQVFVDSLERVSTVATSTLSGAQPRKKAEGKSD